MLFLNDLIEEYSKNISKSIAMELIPKKYASDYIIPYLGEEDTLRCLTIKYMQHSPPKEKVEWSKLEQQYLQSDYDFKKFLVFNLSHELQIATVAALIAYRNPKSNIFEIGPAFGLSSIHFSHYLMEICPNHPFKIPYFMTIERHSGLLKRAKEIKLMTGEYAGCIDYICGDSNRILNDKLIDNDIVFASIAEPNVILGLSNLNKKKKFNMIISFSEKAEQSLVKNDGKITALFNKSLMIKYFEDLYYNSNVKDDIKKFGLIIEVKCTLDD